MNGMMAIVLFSIVFYRSTLVRVPKINQVLWIVGVFSVS